MSRLKERASRPRAPLELSVLGFAIDVPVWVKAGEAGVQVEIKDINLE